MRRTLLFALLCAGMLFASNTKSQDVQKSAPAAGGPLSGRWIITAEYLGTSVNLSMEFKQDGNKLTGNFDGDKLEGTVAGNSVHFLAKDDQGGSEEGTATVQGNSMSGTIIYIEGSNPTHPTNTSFTAKLAGSPAGAPESTTLTPLSSIASFPPPTSLSSPSIPATPSTPPPWRRWRHRRERGPTCDGRQPRNWSLSMLNLLSPETPWSFISCACA